MKAKIVFFGSGDFPVLSLKEILRDNDYYKVVCVVTSKDKNYIYNESVYSIATENNIPVFIPEDVNSEESINYLKSFKADIFCVMSYKKLSTDVLHIPYITSFNIHGSLLPFLKGAAPIQWALRLGLTKTGLTSFLLTDKIDSGPIMGNKIIDIKEEDDYGSLLKRMSEESVNLVRHSLMKIIKKDFLLNIIDQPVIDIEDKIFKAPKINSLNSIIDWDTFESKKIMNYLKSVSPFNGLTTNMYVIQQNNEEEGEIIDKIPIKIYKCHIVNEIPQHMNYYLEYIEKLIDLNFFFSKDRKDVIFTTCRTITDFKKYMYIRTIDNKLIQIDELQLPGKKIMKTSDFLHGFKHCRNKLNIFILSHK